MELSGLLSTKNVFIHLTSSSSGQEWYLTEMFLLIAVGLAVVAVLPQLISRILASSDERRLQEAILTVGRNSNWIGKECPNEGGGSGGRYLIKEGDTIVRCVKCGAIHHLDCWHFNDDTCMNRTCQHEMILPLQILRKSGYSVSRDKRKISLNLRVYYYSICGATAGLIAWFFGALVFPDSYSVIHQASHGIFLVTLVSLSFLLYQRFTNQVDKHSPYIIAFKLFGGTVLGGFALPLTQQLYDELTIVFEPLSWWESISIGLVCWLTFAALIGFGVGLPERSELFQTLKGAIIGGLLSALVYESARVSYFTLISNYEQQIVLGIAFSVLSGTICFFLAFSKQSLERAWVEIVSGKFSGRIYDLTKYMFVKGLGIIGSDEWSSQIYIPDADVLPHHALVTFVDGTPTLVVSSEAKKRANTLINGHKVNKSSMKDGDRLQVGSTMLIYRHKRKRD